MENVIKAAASLSLIFDLIVLIISIAFAVSVAHRPKDFKGLLVIVVFAVLSIINIVNLGFNSKLIYETNEENVNQEYRKGVFIFNIAWFIVLLIIASVFTGISKTLMNSLDTPNVKGIVVTIIILFMVVLGLNIAPFVE